MPLYALVDGQRARATPAGVRRANCADCATRMIAKTGTTVIHHWAHATEQPNCSAAYEGPWHLGWKTLGADGTQEVAVGNRRADVLAPGGFAVEFQASPMTPEEVHAREADWKKKLVWIFDARQAYAEERLVVRKPPDRADSDAYRNLRWAHAPVRIGAATCRSLLDIDGERLIYVGRWFDHSPLQGYGWQVTQEWCIAYVVQGDSICGPPGYQATVDAEQLATKAKTRLLKLRGGWGGTVRLPVKVEPHSCPLCGQSHPVCKWDFGALYCVAPDCANPHHRVPAVPRG